MKKLGIVAEYNPFHYGHKYHIETAKAKSGADLVIAIMSGNFTQRGEPACADKWTRAHWALSNGVDLVIELPAAYATSDAGHFTKAGVSILEKFGVDFISFGIDQPEEMILEVSRIISEHKDLIQDKFEGFIKEGYSYPKAKAKALGIKELKSPNSILALGYLENIKSAQPIMIPRSGTGYNEHEVTGLPSSTAIRYIAALRGDYSMYVPEPVKDILPFNKEKLWEIAISKAMEMDPAEIDLINSADEGFGNLIKKVARTTSTYDQLLTSLKSKRYTQTRIKRFIMQLILGITREDVASNIEYARVLGFNEKGSSFLKEFKKQDSSLEIITNINKFESNRILDIDIRANDFYNVIYHKDLYQNSDFVKKPVIITVDK